MTGAIPGPSITPLLNRVRRTILDRKLFSSGSRVLIACSGGPDSTALVHVVHRLSGEMQLELHVACVDHGIRPEAKDEVAAVGRFSESLGLPFLTLAVQLPARPSIQADARRLRYEALAAAAERIGGAKIAVGHTRDDQAETVLDRMLRGASVRGLAGIAPRRADGVVRPLIDASRADVLAYVSDMKLDTFADPSNRNRAFKRVRIREEVLPLLAGENPNVRAILADLADDCRALARALRHQAEAHIVANPGLSLDALLALDEPLRREVLRLVVFDRTRISLSRAKLLAADRILFRPGEVLLGNGFVLSTAQKQALCVLTDTTRKTRRRGNPD